MYINSTMSKRYLMPFVATFRAKRQQTACDTTAIEHTFAIHKLRFSTERAREKLIEFILSEAPRAPGSRIPGGRLGAARA